MKTYREFVLNESVPSMSQDDFNKIFDSLKSKQKVDMWAQFVMSSRKGEWRTFIVGRKSVSKKYNSEKISLTPEGAAKTAKYFLYRKNGKVSVAQGDMGGSLLGLKTS